ncbi:MAG: YbjN domain-containing protein [Paraburkholderia sp.]|jgi:hypothetical protein|uniref:YbjN domain-containing protein n=1 Tax=Burkholderiaceae TaxID=119060 RepID=UPI0010F7F19A|nr:YbjN domain-containing protein [Burkholderia sp. 4M9327F10]
MTTAKGSETKTAGAPVSGLGIAPVDAVSVEQLADIFRSAGYRVTPAEQNGRVQLMSASQGVGFVVRFGNPGAAADTHIDYTLSCAIQVQGELPADLVPSWNRTKRFARLAAHQQFLLLEMDVMVAGGVTERYLRSTIELWDRLVQEFLLHLRNRPAMAVEQAATQAAAHTPVDAGAQAGGPDDADGSKATLQ